MTDAHDSAFAYPTVEYQDEDRGDVRIDEGQRGLTKREYFAALAMQAMASRPDFYYTDSDRMSANTAVMWADALIAALNKEAK
jgi:hypothetical protein